MRQVVQQLEREDHRRAALILEAGGQRPLAPRVGDDGRGDARVRVTRARLEAFTRVLGRVDLCTNQPVNRVQIQPLDIRTAPPSSRRRCVDGVEIMIYALASTPTYLQFTNTSGAVCFT